METQVNVAAGDGEPVAGKRSTWSDGINEWFNIRIPKNAATEPTSTDYDLSCPLDAARRRHRHDGLGLAGSPVPALRLRLRRHHRPRQGHRRQRRGTWRRSRRRPAPCPTSKSAAAPAAAASTSTSTSTRRHPHREPHRTRRPGPLHPGHDVRRDGLRLRLPDRRLRRTYVDLAPEDDAPRTRAWKSSSRPTKVSPWPICRPTGGTISRWSSGRRRRSASTRSPKKIKTRSRP